MKAIRKNYIQALSKKIFGRQIFLRFLFFYIFLFSFPFPSLVSLFSLFSFHFQLLFPCFSTYFTETQNVNLSSFYLSLVVAVFW